MRAGDLDRRIQVLAKTVTQSSSGQEIETWGVIHDLSAKVRQIRGTEAFMSQQTVAQAETKFTVRYLKGITPLNRILYDQRTYDIVSVAEIGRREVLEIMAKTRAE